MSTPTPAASMSASRPMIGEFAQLIGAALLGAAILFGIGYVPTRQMGGDGAVVGMSIGLGICVIASTLGAIPIVCYRDPKPATRQVAFLGTIAVRMLTTLLLFAVVALSRKFDAKSLAIWTGTGYLALLGIETFTAIRLIKRRDGGLR